MKRTFKLSVRIKRTEKIFAEGFEPGVIATQEVVYDIAEADYDRPSFMASLMDKQETMMNEHVEVQIQEVKE